MKPARTWLRQVERLWHSEGPRQDTVYTKQKREVTTKPFSHRRSFQDVFNDCLKSRVPVAPGLHVSDFPNRIARAIVLPRVRQLSVAANDEITVPNKLLLRVH